MLIKLLTDARKARAERIRARSTINTADRPARAERIEARRAETTPSRGRVITASNRPRGRVITASNRPKAKAYKGWQGLAEN